MVCILERKVQRNEPLPIYSSKNLCIKYGITIASINKYLNIQEAGAATKRVPHSIHIGAVESISIFLPIYAFLTAYINIINIIPAILVIINSIGAFLTPNIAFSNIDSRDIQLIFFTKSICFIPSSLSLTPKDVIELVCPICQ